MPDDGLLNKDEIDQAVVGFEDRQGHHGRVADAAARKMAWWLVDYLIDISEQARPHNYEHGKAILAVAERIGREFKKAGIQPWPDVPEEE